MAFPQLPKLSLIQDLGLKVREKISPEVVANVKALLLTVKHCKKPQIPQVYPLQAVKKLKRRSVIIFFSSHKSLVQKINGVFYLNRAEAIDYLIKAYSLKWCNTRWSSGQIRFTCELSNGSLKNIRLPAYKTKGNKTVRVRKDELDLYFLS